MPRSTSTAAVTHRPTRATETMAKFNNAHPLTVVQLPLVEGETEPRLGIVDEERSKMVWVERDFVSRPYSRDAKKNHVTLPQLPEHYGKWEHKTSGIGGVADTWRVQGLIRAKPDVQGPVTLFATHAPTADAIPLAFCGLEHEVTVGDALHDGTYGHVCEVMVHDPKELGHAAAVIARTGAKVVLEDAERVNACRELGVERLDRVGAKVTEVDAEAKQTKEMSDYGPHRGEDNFRFSWLPASWQVPITWDYLVQNVLQHIGVDTVSHLSDPLRQHVAAVLLEDEDGDLTEAQRKALKRHIRPKRFVSAHLTTEQTKQIIQCFYHLEVERVQDPLVARACGLVLYRYMVERGYSARWLGQYKQTGDHVGNGDTFRNFARLRQYAPERLPARVLNKLSGRDGRLHGRGSKGSRSKYIDKAKRYQPKTTLKRTRVVEERMRTGGM